MSRSQSETTVTIAASLRRRSASHRPRTQRPVSFASIGRGTRRCFSRDLRKAGRRLLAAVDVGVRQSDDPAGVADLPRVAVARLRHDRRMQEKPDVAAVADDAEAAFAPNMAGKVKLRRILDRQHMAPARRLGRMTGRRAEPVVAGRRCVMQKSANRPRSRLDLRRAGEDRPSAWRSAPPEARPPLQPFVAEQPQICHALQSPATANHPTCASESEPGAAWPEKRCVHASGRRPRLQERRQSARLPRFATTS